MSRKLVSICLDGGILQSAENEKLIEEVRDFLGLDFEKILADPGRLISITDRMMEEIQNLI